MKLHPMLISLRGILGILLVFILPYIQLQWGKPYPEEGQSMGIFLIFLLFSIIIAILYIVLGSIGHYLLRRWPKYIFLSDSALWILFVALEVYIALTARIS